MRFRPIYSVDTGPSVSASVARTSAELAKAEVDSLRMEIERLLMITEALWEILKEEFGCEDSELLDRIQKIDERDGRADGRVSPGEVKVCAKCNRPLERKRPACIYCGEPAPITPFDR